jgi:CheY-like chemotaxis protein
MDHDVTVVFLLVQDDPADEMFTREAFELYKLRNALHAVPSARRALSFLDRAAPYSEAPVPDMVLLDLNLPGADGRLVLRRLRTDPATAEVPVVLLVDSPVAEEILRSEKLPVQGYATKPVDFDSLTDIVRSVPELGFTVSRHPAAG